MARSRPVLPMLLVVLGTAVGSAATHADDPAPSVRPAADALELSRRARHAGDADVLARLSPDRGREERLEAVREAPSMRAPEAALELLVELARGRDPALAPAAALAIDRITSVLDRPALEAREVDPRSLAGVRDSLRRLEADTTARPDLRRLAAFSAARLSELVGGR
ncbi:MAG: hypothetical protein U0230_18635 [Polyangiales bacterium]